MFNPEKLPLGIYLHFPWCVAKCPYCDFNSHQLRGTLNESSYIDALCIDLIDQAQLVKGRLVSTIFMGGGTPSLFSSQSIGKVLDCIGSHYDLQADCEVTLEANPGTFEQDKFAGYVSAGVNRLSIGVQSFSDQALKRLGRIHRSNEAKKAIEKASKLGFKSINVDLMYGLPQQTQAEMMDDLKMACGFEPDHLSWYELTIEPKTAFYKRPPILPSEASKDLMAEEGWQFLAHAGYQRYEVSAYAQSGHICKHNQQIWQFGDYLGCGAGASGKYTTKDAIMRTEKKSHPKYYASLPKSFAKEYPVSMKDLPFEVALCCLRLAEGMPWSWVCERTGEGVETYLRKHAPQGSLDDSTFKLVGDYFNHYNSVMMNFCPD